jgi:hypothetical protein
MKWTGYRGNEKCVKNIVETTEEKNHREDTRVDGRILLK